MPGKVVSEEEWLVARKALLTREKEVTRISDTLASEIEALPMVKITKNYVFSTPTGTASLLDLFEGRQQLIVYHFMFPPDDPQGCSSCSFFADHIPDLRHLHSRNTSFAVVSRASIAKIQAFKKRMGWAFPWYSSLGSDFNYDFHVTQDEAVAPVNYNFMSKEELEKKGLSRMTKGEKPGLSVFTKDGDTVFHTYSSYARGLDKMLGTYVMLDVTPLGRQDTNAAMGTGFSYHNQY